MRKHKPLPTDKLLTICVDCLGTYPIEEFQWRSSRKGSAEGLSWEALKQPNKAFWCPNGFAQPVKYAHHPMQEVQILTWESLAIRFEKTY
jgi:hypothetical protein